MDTGTFLEEHMGDLVRGALAEELAGLSLVVGDAVLFDEGNKVRRGKTGQNRLAEMAIFGDIVFRRNVEMGEVALSSAGDEDLTADLWGVVEEQDSPAAFSGLAGAHEAGRAGAEYDDVVTSFHRVIRIERRIVQDVQRIGKGTTFSEARNVAVAEGMGYYSASGGTAGRRVGV
jgi:hypothetical protein